MGDPDEMIIEQFGGGLRMLLAAIFIGLFVFLCSFISPVRVLRLVLAGLASLEADEEHERRSVNRTSSWHDHTAR